MTSTLPAFLDGKPKLLFIDGRSVPAVSGKLFDTVNPSTGEPLAQVAEAAAPMSTWLSLPRAVPSKKALGAASSPSTGSR